MYQRYIKRSLDFILSLIALILLPPVFVIVSLLVRIKLGSPVLFKQEISVWKLLHLRPIFEDETFFQEKKCYSEHFFLRGVCLPSDTKMDFINQSLLKL